MSSPGDGELIDDVVRRIAGRHDAGAEVISVVRQQSRYIGSYPCEQIDVRLTNGFELGVFFKDYSSSKQSKDGPQARRDRELHVYRDLLVADDRATARYLDSLWEEDGRHWLFLELLEGESVQAADGRHGHLAVEWLAQHQARALARSDVIATSPLLVRYDMERFRVRAERALIETTELAPALAGRLEPIVADAHATVELLGRQPSTLVHGGFIPWHVIVDEREDPPRSCAIDWELAGHGPTLYDLAYFIDDADPNTRRELTDRYLAAAGALGVPTPVEPERAIAWLRVHRVFDWLSRASEKDTSASRMGWLVDRTAQLWAETSAR